MIKLNDKTIMFNHFNDGSCRVQIDIPDGDCSFSLKVTWLYERDEEFLQLYYLVNHLRSHFFNNLSLVMPYCPNCRMDRVKSDSDVFTLKYFSKLINDMNFSSVEIYDPHSYVSPALLNNVIVRSPIQEIQGLLDAYSWALLFYPDEGSMKRLHSYFEVPYAFGVKERDWETQKITSLQIAGSRHMIAGRDILICDDILSRGSTIYAASKRLKELGAKNIYVYVSHCENTVLKPNLNGQSLLDIPDLITKVYTTNSIFTKNHPKVEIIKRF